MACALSEKRPSVVTSTRASPFSLAGFCSAGAAPASGAGGRPPGPLNGVDTPPCAALAPGTPQTPPTVSAGSAVPGSVVGSGAGAASDFAAADAPPVAVGAGGEDCLGALGAGAADEAGVVDCAFADTTSESDMPNAVHHHRWAVLDRAMNFVSFSRIVCSG